MKTLLKVGDLLRQFTAERPEHSVTDLARALGHSVSSTHDLVNGLGRIGLLRKVQRGRYRLGPLVATLSRALEDSSTLIKAARPVLTGLWNDYGETLHLTVEDHGRLLILDSMEGTQALRVSRESLGSQIALHKSPPGMLHLATFSALQLDEYLAHHAQPGGDLRDTEDFRNRLAQISAEGFLAGTITQEQDVVYVSAIIEDHIPSPVAVLALSVPRSRYDAQPRAFRNITMEAVRRISTRLRSDHGWH